MNIIIGRTHRFKSIVKDLLKKYKFDIIVFDNSKTSFRLIDIVHQHGCKAIVINHNFEYEYIRDNSKGLFRPFNLYWIKKVEKDAAQKADLNLTLSNQDTRLLCDAFRNGNQDNFSLLGTFEYYSTAPQKYPNVESQQNRFVITGNLSAIQTVKSLLPWIQDYYNILKKIFPTATLTIAGKKPGPELQAICKEKNIELIASPCSMDPIMENADYYICPTSLGGGIKLRVMDGLKWGLPVLTHSVSARGYDLFIEKGCMFSYSDTNSFKESLIKLKQIQFDKQQVYNTYAQTFSFEAGVKRIKTILKNLK